MQIFTSAYLLLTLIFPVSSSVHHIVTESQMYSCSGDLCLTLSEFVDNLNNYADANIMLSFYDGTHSLVQGLSISNVFNLSMISMSMGYTNTIDTTIECNRNVKIHFKNVDSLYISGLKFSDCGGIRIETVERVIIESSQFLGGKNNYRSLLTVIRTSGTVRDTAFLSNSVVKHTDEEESYPTACEYAEGGALVVIQSRIVLNNCKFKDNKANQGGAISSHSESNITINNCNFTSNCATECNHKQPCLGGALFIGENCTLSVHNSSFINNTSDGNGGVATIVNAALFMSHSFTYNNTARCIKW